MMQWLEYLSGNVPGGIFLYGFLLIVTFFILFFMYRVNELFLRKHLLRWFIVSFIFYSIIYLLLWFNNPPSQVYKRYGVFISGEDPHDQWFAKYLTDITEQNVEPYFSQREFLFMDRWFYNITPSDSALSRKFRMHAFETIPIHRVLVGQIKREGMKFQVKYEFLQFPGHKIIKVAQAEFNIYNIQEYLHWVRTHFGDELPFRSKKSREPNPQPDSLLELIKIRVYQNRLDEAEKTLKKANYKKIPHPEYSIWEKIVEIRRAGNESRQNQARNPYATTLPGWKKQMVAAREHLLGLLRLGREGMQLELPVAESYLWEEDFASAEIFLKKAYIENPFNIDVLINLSFIHPSRYREFGMANRQDIYLKILDICPIQEAVLIQWSDTILRDNPPYTSPPTYAKKRVLDYLSINPHSFKAWLMLGKIHAQALHRSDALAAFLKADSISPQNGLVCYNIGALYYEWKKPEQAKKYIMDAIQFDNYLDAYLYLGSILKDEGNYRAALQNFRYRVAHKQGEDDFYAYQAMKGIQECLEALGEKPD
ncbi:MAG: hypothetical protein JSW33_08600 [bacterium]|nr:MAG: hypothetical protein JSW33_08600 [bacterium]